MSKFHLMTCVKLLHISSTLLQPNGELYFYCSSVKEHAAGSQQNSNTSMQNLREVCEQALTAAGLHITLGGSLWDAYR